MRITDFSELPDGFDLKTMGGEIRVVDRQGAIVATMGDLVAVTGELAGHDGLCLTSSPNLRASGIVVLEANPSSPAPSANPIGEFVGVLGQDSVCLFLFAGFDAYQLILPDRFEVGAHAGRTAIVDRDGKVIAAVGDEIAIDGKAVGGGGSYCANVPQLHVSEIVVLTPR